MSAGHGPAVASPAIPIIWGSGGVCFQLESDEAAVRRRAAQVLRPWVADTGPAPTRDWSIRHVEAAHTWETRSAGTSTITRHGSLEQAVTAVEFLAVQHLFDNAVDTLAAHAACASKDGRAVLIFGPSGSGKSTLAGALWQSGFALLGDDIAVLDPGTHTAAPAPRRVALRDGSRPLLGESLWKRLLDCPASERTSEGCLFHPDELDGVPRGPARIAACVFLARRGAPTTPLPRLPIPSALSVLAMLPYFNQSRRFDPGTVIARLAGFAAAVPAFDLSRAPLETMTDVVAGILDGGIG